MASSADDCLGPFPLPFACQLWKVCSLVMMTWRGHLEAVEVTPETPDQELQSPGCQLLLHPRRLLQAGCHHQPQRRFLQKKFQSKVRFLYPLHTNITSRYKIESVYLTVILQNHAEYHLIIRGYYARLSRIIVLLFNALIPKHSFHAEKILTISILPLFSPTLEITYIAGYLLTKDDEY